MASIILASDYDGTLAENGRVDAKTLAALRDFRDAGNCLVMVTGRELDDLRNVFPEMDVFAHVIAENGALLHETASGKQSLLAAAPPPEFLDLLRRKVVGPLYVGQVIVATLCNQEQAVQDVIDHLHLPLQIILNKEALMVLPTGVNKAFGLRHLLEKLQVPREQCIAVGDAENDLDLLAAAGCGVAVANAIPELKAKAQWVTREARGAGVAELIGRVLNGDYSNCMLR